MNRKVRGQRRGRGEEKWPFSLKWVQPRGGTNTLMCTSAFIQALISASLCTWTVTHVFILDTPEPLDHSVVCSRSHSYNMAEPALKPMDTSLPWPQRANHVL